MGSKGVCSVENSDGTCPISTETAEVARESHDDDDDDGGLLTLSRTTVNKRVGTNFEMDSRDKHSVRIKCYVATEDQQGSNVISTTQYGSYKWARMYGDSGKYNGKRLLFDGKVQPLSGLFQFESWNDLYGRPLTPATLAEACKDTIHDRAKKNAFFLFARTGCLDVEDIAGIVGQQGNFNKCDYWPTSGGPFISFNTVPAHQTWVTFGDSLSDFGGNQILWFRMGLGHSPWYPAMFSNGPIWQMWLSRALRGQWQSPGVEDVVSPYEGFTSFACGGAVAGQIKPPEDAPRSFMDRLKLAATDPMLGDFRDQISWRDEWAREYKDPFGVTTSEKCDKDDLTCPESGGPDRAQCVQAACGEDGKCSHYVCTCLKGFVNREDVCTPVSELSDMPTLEQGGPFAFVWLGANDLNFPKRLSSHTEFLDRDNTEYLSAAATITRTIDTIITGLDSLFLRGYRNFALGNLPNLGITPSNLRDMPSLDPPAPFNEFTTDQDKEDRKRLYRSLRITEITQEFNERLKKRLDEWKATHGVTMAFVDIWSTFNEVTSGRLEHPDGTVEDYTYPLDTGSDSFQYLDGAAYGQPKVKVWKECFPEMLGWAPGRDICADQDRAIFWDGVHPSTRVHCWIGYAWHLALFKTGKWPVPDVENYKNMCGSTKAWNGHVVRTKY